LKYIRIPGNYKLAFLGVPSTVASYRSRSEMAVKQRRIEKKTERMKRMVKNMHKKECFFRQRRGNFYRREPGVDDGKLLPKKII